MPGTHTSAPSKALSRLPSRRSRSVWAQERCRAHKWRVAVAAGILGTTTMNREETHEWVNQVRTAAAVGRPGRSGRAGHGAGAGLSQRQGDLRGAVPARRLDRHQHAHRGRQALTDVGPARADRQQGRRQRHHRRRSGDARQARRLHGARHLVDDARRQSLAV